jgi:hypothetical protein
LVERKIMTDHILPEEVNSPKQHWNLIKVLDDGAADGCALALGYWDRQLVLALRWNGSKDNRIGNPQSRGIPTWFVVPKRYNDDLLNSRSLPAEMRDLARRFLPQDAA